MSAHAPAQAAAPTTPAFPVVVEPGDCSDLDEGLAWLARAWPGLRAELPAQGAFLLRGLSVRAPRDVAKVRDVLGLRPAGQPERLLPRDDLGHGLHAAAAWPPDKPMCLHNEHSYALSVPRVLVLACLAPAMRGGATLLGDCREVLARLPSGLVERFEEHGWLLSRNLREHIGMRWQDVFGTDDPAEADDYCARNGIARVWHRPNHLRTLQRRAAIVAHPLTGQRCWFNHVAFLNRWGLDPDEREVLTAAYGEGGLPADTSLGDGTALTSEEIDVIAGAYDEAAVRVTLRAGDVLVLDNITMAHGREPFEGSRSVAVAMGEPVGLHDCAPAHSLQIDG